MTKWKLVGRVIADGEPISLHGVDPWPHRWRLTGEPPIIVPHPQYPLQRHSMTIFEITEGDKHVRFAAGEFSNCAWGFYLPEE